MFFFFFIPLPSGPQVFSLGLNSAKNLEDRLPKVIQPCCSKTRLRPPSLVEHKYIFVFGQHQESPNSSRFTKHSSSAGSTLRSNDASHLRPPSLEEHKHFPTPRQCLSGPRCSPWEQILLGFSFFLFLLFSFLNVEAPHCIWLSNGERVPTHIQLLPILTYAQHFSILFLRQDYLLCFGVGLGFSQSRVSGWPGTRLASNL